MKFDRSRLSRKLYGEELNNYLKSKLIIFEPPNDFPTYSNRNLDEMISFLKDKGKLVLEFSRKKLFSNYCPYRFLLDMVYNTYREKLRKGEVDESFNVFVKKNLNISPHYALKLRTVGKIWYRYKKFEHLSISFDEFYRRKDEILFLMQNHPDIASAWQDINDDFDLDIDLNA